MPNKLALIPAVALALVVAHDIKTQIKTKQLAELFATAYVEMEENQHANVAQIQYLCHKLNEANLDADEFDLIVLNYHQ